MKTKQNRACKTAESAYVYSTGGHLSAAVYSPGCDAMAGTITSDNA